MAIEFMTGATVFALINLTFVLLMCYMMYRIITKTIRYERKEIERLNTHKEIAIFCVSAIILFGIGVGTAAQPKLKIDTSPNRPLIEYQEEDSEVVIQTPPPRTETLDGFEPLKQ